MECEPNNPLCYPIIRDIESYLNREEVQEALGVDRAYKGCNMDVNLKVKDLKEFRINRSFSSNSRLVSLLH